MVREVNVMNTIDEYYNYECERITDINEHLPTLKRYAEECDHITEMGVRTVVSTWAFLAGRPKKLVSIDIQPCDVSAARTLASEASIEFEFIQADTANPDFIIENTDLLFIDTWHIYEQLQAELRLHAPRTNKYIIMHDTTLFGDEGTPEWFNSVTQQVATRRGLWPAIEEFLEANPEWRIKERFTHNNGLTVLERI